MHGAVVADQGGGLGAQRLATASSSAATGTWGLSGEIALQTTDEHHVGLTRSLGNFSVGSNVRAVRKRMAHFLEPRKGGFLDVGFGEPRHASSSLWRGDRQELDMADIMRRPP